MKTPRVYNWGEGNVTIAGKEHARIDVALLKKYPVSALSRESGISVSAINAAKKSNGHVRKLTKAKLMLAVLRLRRDPKYMALEEAIENGVVSHSEINEALLALSRGIGEDAWAISFKNWDAEKVPIFKEHNDLVCMAEELQTKVNKFSKKIKAILKEE